MVGSAIVRELRRQGYDNLVLRTHAELDLTRQADVEAFFEGNLTWEMIEDTLKTECGITIDLSDDLAARR